MKFKQDLQLSRSNSLTLFSAFVKYSTDHKTNNSELLVQLSTRLLVVCVLFHFCSLLLAYKAWFHAMQYSQCLTTIHLLRKALAYKYGRRD